MGFSAIYWPKVAPNLNARQLIDSNKKSGQSDRLAAGPGKLCRALQIDRSLNGQQLKAGDALWLEPRTPEFQNSLDSQENSLIQTTRIGISAGKDLPWRWYIANCPAVSQTSAKGDRGALSRATLSRGTGGSSG